ncbi:MAG TPA: NAD(+) synthase [Pelomicrobium sp.]|nr:NAD(+) synthase [Pelomicrobium sp.]
MGAVLFSRRARHAVTFFDPAAHGFCRVAVAVPEIRVADPAANAETTVALLRRAADELVDVAVFPELGLTGYSCEDLFHQQALLDGALGALAQVLAASRELPVLAAVGLPLALDGLLYSCAAVLHRGRLLGIVPKTYLPNYREFYERRQFTPGECATFDEIRLFGERVPFGSRLLFAATDAPRLKLHVEICEDLWVPIPPSSYAALAGATVLANLSASNVTLAKHDYRRQLVGNQSGRCIAAYAYAAAGAGESTTDLAWDGHGMIYENGSRLAETERFAREPQLAVADVDLERLTQDRMRQSTFADTVRTHHERLAGFRTVGFELARDAGAFVPLKRALERFPYVPADPAQRDERCREVYEIQVQGLTTRLKSAGVDKVVIGVSGGLDSTQALIVCARAMDLLGLPRRNILAYSLPGYATSARTRAQAMRLMQALGCEANELDIRASCEQMFKDIGHPYTHGHPVYDVTFENVQAGERTSHLFRLANQRGALVVGTSDLSELALGWCTYGVGDHMAHYHVNASVPKTLIQYLIRWAADTHQLGEAASPVLLDVLETEISPELVPSSEEDQPGQRTEDVVGPYELVDFFLYYVLRFGYAPTKVAYLAWCAWHSKALGAWPDIPEAKRRQYRIAEIKRWLGVFLHRFFAISQYKRSAIPNAPKVGSGGSLSPRGDWRAPSDGSAAPWLAQLELVPERDSAPAPAPKRSAKPAARRPTASGRRSKHQRRP